MTLNIIGLGLKDEKSVSVEALEVIKKSDKLYLEIYTSKLTDATIEDLEKFYNKKIIPANRDIVENKAEETILKDAKDKETSFLIIGDPFSATTHMDMMQRAKEKDIKVNIYNNASVLNAIGIVGLELYKYGKTTSIPFNNKNISTPVDVYNLNQKMGLHTLFLLDLDPENNKFMQCTVAADFLIEKGIEPNTKIICCAGIGSNNPEIITTKLNNVSKLNKTPQCLIIPGSLHFMEEELIDQYKK